MLDNYFKIAWRSLWKNKLFSLINIGGLALGLAVFIFIMQYVAFEWTANRFNKNYDRLYRVNVQYKEGNTEYFLPPGFAPIIKEKFTGIEDYVRTAGGIGNGVIQFSSSGKGAGIRSFREENTVYADAGFLKVFTFPLVSGTPSLLQPQTMALSESVAAKYFGRSNAVGKTVSVSNQFGNTPYTVTAVFKSPPGQNDINADILLSLHTLENPANRNDNDWADPKGIGSGMSNIYLLLKKGINPKLLAAQITQFVRSINADSKTDVVYLQPFSEMHLAPSFDYPYQTFGSLLLVTVFAAIALLILLVAWVNYINLSTAQSLQRAREAGVRKVLGATRFQLIKQYLTETFFVTAGALIIALLLVNIFQPMFNGFTGKQLSSAIFNSSIFWLGGISIILLGSLLAGGYVAFVLSAFKPVKTIRGKIADTANGFSMRKSLVVFQFTISIMFIIAVIIVYNQLQYMKTENLGMNLKQLVVIKGPTVTGDNQSQKNVAFKNEVTQLPFIEKYAGSNNVPGQGYNFFTNGITRTSPQPGDEKNTFAMLISDERFFDTYGISFIQGTSFSVNDAEKSWNTVRKVIINQKAAQQFGFGKDENIVGQKILWGKPFEIIGVVKDYHHLSLREAIKPTIYLASASSGYLTVKTSQQKMEAKLNAIKKIYDKQFAGNPFEYFFADELYDKQYTEEQKLGQVFVSAAFVACLIACMGLFGLATFSAHQRIKEIGIRKVLGASVTQIAALLSGDFIKLVFIAIVIASPLAWFAMRKWLQNFAYRVDINWWIFLFAGITAIGIALLTVSFQAIKAAVANPVKSLRTE